ncbi:MAG: D-aminoacyl-tRNA deacylase, partial [Dehalococcoidia bacterium]|nr:D-aminoacyl-tRNA deacylase [Dehalococcoidia bacterium]
MRALIQRVTEASVSVHGEVLGRIGPGLVVFVGVAGADEERHIEYIVSKTVNLRIFEDPEGRFNLSALD